MNLNNPDNEVVSHCPLRGHAPLCTNGECKKERDNNNWDSCRKLFKNW
jgi:hypothetical protein